MLKDRFEIKTNLVGPGEEKEAKILNRIIRVDEEGWQYEADQRHAEVLIQEMGLTEAKGVGTTGEPRSHGRKMSRTRSCQEQMVPNTEGWLQEPTTWPWTGQISSMPRRRYADVCPHRQGEIWARSAD